VTLERPSRLVGSANDGARLLKRRIAHCAVEGLGNPIFSSSTRSDSRTRERRRRYRRFPRTPSTGTLVGWSWFYALTLSKHHVRPCTEYRAPESGTPAALASISPPSSRSRPANFGVVTTSPVGGSSYDRRCRRPAITPLGVRSADRRAPPAGRADSTPAVRSPPALSAPPSASTDPMVRRRTARMQATATR
jgi:hypothetical protein